MILGMHNGEFNSDDILCYILIKKFYDKNITLKRYNEDDVKRIFKECKYVLNLGNRNEVINNCIYIDYRQSKAIFENEIPMSTSCVLLKYLLNTKKISKHVYEYLLENLFYGVAAETFNYKCEYMSKLLFIKDFNLNESETMNYNLEQYQQFIKIAAITEKLFDRIYSKALN